MSVTKLVDIDIDKVASVDRAANQRKFLIVKRADEEEIEITPEQLAEQIIKAGKMLSKDNVASLLEAHSKIMQMLMNAGVDPYSVMDKEGLYKKESDNVKMMKKEDFMKMDKDKMYSEYEKMYKAYMNMDEEMKKSAEVEKKDTSVEEFIKMESLPSEVREQLKKSQEMEARIAKMEEERIEKKYNDEAGQFSNLAADDLKDILKFVGESDQDLYGKLTGVLKSADSAIEKGDLFKEMGTAGAEVTGDAIVKMEAKRDEIMKSEGLSKEMAFVKAMELNPKLYEEYEKEMGGNR